MNADILVSADWAGLEGPKLLGTLRATESRGSEIFSFTYDPDWLVSALSTLLDPDLQFFEGPQYLGDETRSNFGLFLDSSPDRWGRLLMRRRESALARRDQRELRRLTEADYLLGVHDEQRLGALRFQLDPNGNFLSDEAFMATPPWTSLRELEHASWQLQDNDRSLDSSMLEWLNLLIAPGSSLGGARPKAGVRDPEGDLWIAKFPGRHDDRDMGAWEWLVWQLANHTGLQIPEAKMMRIGRRHHTFARKRFDRVSGSHGEVRLHFASAMTLLGYNDGADHAQGVSYLEFVEFLSSQGAEVAADLEELWRRIVFSICIHNTDDHLRNHGFLLTDGGWKLSLAYDLNPDPLGRGLSLNISENDNALELELAMKVAPYFRLKPGDANRVLREVTSAVADWKRLAKEAGLRRAEIEEMEPAFKFET